MATHSSILAWRILWTEEPGGLLSTGSQSRTRLKRLSMHMHARVPRGQVPLCPAAREAVKNTDPSPERCGDRKSVV